MSRCRPEGSTYPSSRIACLFNAGTQFRMDSWVVVENSRHTQKTGAGFLSDILQSHFS